jgi:hypothetical protein
MTEAEQQELFARLERLERSAWRWRVFASVLAVFFLLLLSLGLVSAVAVRRAESVRLREALKETERARAAAEEAAAQQRQAEADRQAAGGRHREGKAQGAKGQGDEARPQRPAGDNPLDQ